MLLLEIVYTNQTKDYYILVKKVDIILNENV